MLHITTITENKTNTKSNKGSEFRTLKNRPAGSRSTTTQSPEFELSVHEFMAEPRRTENKKNKKQKESPKEKKNPHSTTTTPNREKKTLLKNFGLVSD